MHPWKPIITAPKGGGADSCDDPRWVEPPVILLRFGDEGVSLARWDWAYAPGGYFCTDGVGWLEPCSGTPLSNMFGRSATHWMGVPPFPVPDVELRAAPAFILSGIFKFLAKIGTGAEFATYNEKSGCVVACGVVGGERVEISVSVKAIP